MYILGCLLKYSENRPKIIEKYFAIIKDVHEAVRMCVYGDGRVTT